MYQYLITILEFSLGPNKIQLNKRNSLQIDTALKITILSLPFYIIILWKLKQSSIKSIKLSLILLLLLLFFNLSNIQFSDTPLTRDYNR